MEPQRPVAIVVDSAASLPPDHPSMPLLYVVPMRLVLDGKTYRDGVDLKALDLYRALRDLGRPPTTSAPAPSDFMDAFRDASRHASSVLCITVSRRFSSSLNAAHRAVEEAKEALPDTQIVVMDSGSAAGGEGLAATEAWRAARGGCTLDQAAAAAQHVVSRVSLLAFLDTLYYLWKGGRVPRLAYAGASLLGIKPLFELRSGEVRNLGRPRTSRRAARRLVDLMHRGLAGPAPIHAAVMHVDAVENAERLKDMVASEFECQELFVSEFSPVMGAHTGPGLLGVAFWG